jgi:hypothetical protein
MSETLLTPEQRIRQRYTWFQRAEELENVTQTWQRAGISQKTFHKWRRLQEGGEACTAPLDRSQRPHRVHRRLGKALQQRTQLGPARLRALLVAQGARAVPSVVTLAKCLHPAGLTRRRRPRPKRYRRAFVVPRLGTLVQLDVKCVPYLVEGRQLYQYTAIHCCTRLRLVQLSEEMAVSTSKALVQYCPEHLPLSGPVGADG